MNVNEDENLSLKAQKAWQFTELLLARVDFQKDVEKFRGDWQPHEGGFTDKTAQREWEDARSRELVRVFIQSGKYSLDSVSLLPLLAYIEHGSTGHPLMGELPRISIRPDEITRNPVYIMRFYEHTTEAEIRKVFNSYKSVHLKDKRQQLIPASKLKKMQLAHELRESSMTWRQVASAVNEKLGGSLEYNDANKLVQQYKKHLGL